MRQITRKMHIIDLSHRIENGMPVFPGTPEVKIEQLYTVEKDGFAEKALGLVTHVGTHMDAPAHMIGGGKTLDQYPISKFSGNACLIPFSWEDIDEQAQDEYLSEFESVIRDCDFVILNTGWSEKWGNPAYFKNYPALDKKGAEYLSGFRLDGIGIDAISIDQEENTQYEVHHEVLGNDIVIIENLCHLDTIRSQVFRFSALPLFISGADGSPVRAIAEY